MLFRGDFFAERGDFLAEVFELLEDIKSTKFKK
jgi:hypothetical protein